jgi:thiol-disulfide isomerase/thioredoxin
MEKKITKFYGNGCLNCKALAPIFDAVKEEYPHIKFAEINTSTNEDAAAAYKITTLPTILFELDGKEVARMQGLKPKSLIKKQISDSFASNN